MSPAVLQLKQLYERLSDASARLEAVVFIAGMLGDGDSLADPLQELLEEDSRAFDECFPDAPMWLQKALDDGSHGADAFYEWAMEAGKLGFAVKVATPVMEHGCSGSTYSWGYYRFSWVYGETLDAAIEAGLAWVERQRTEEKEKSAAAGGRS